MKDTRLAQEEKGAEDAEQDRCDTDLVRRNPGIQKPARNRQGDLTGRPGATGKLPEPGGQSIRLQRSMGGAGTHHSGRDNNSNGKDLVDKASVLPVLEGCR